MKDILSFRNDLTFHANVTLKKNQMPDFDVRYLIVDRADKLIHETSFHTPGGELDYVPETIYNDAKLIAYEHGFIYEDFRMHIEPDVFEAHKTFNSGLSFMVKGYMERRDPMFYLFKQVILAETLCPVQSIQGIILHMYSFWVNGILPDGDIFFRRFMEYLRNNGYNDCDALSKAFIAKDLMALIAVFRFLKATFKASIPNQPDALIYMLGGELGRYKSPEAKMKAIYGLLKQDAIRRNMKLEAGFDDSKLKPGILNYGSFV